MAAEGGPSGAVSLRDVAQQCAYGGGRGPSGAGPKPVAGLRLRGAADARAPAADLATEVFSVAGGEPYVLVLDSATLPLVSSTFSLFEVLERGCARSWIPAAPRRPCAPPTLPAATSSTGAAGQQPPADAGSAGHLLSRSQRALLQPHAPGAEPRHRRSSPPAKANHVGATGLSGAGGRREPGRLLRAAALPGHAAAQGLRAHVQVGPPRHHAPYGALHTRSRVMGPDASPLTPRAVRQR